MARKSDFVSESRSLATDFVKQSDRYRSLAQEFAFGGYAAAPEAGGLSDEDFGGENASVTKAQIVAFYQALGVLLATITDEQRAIFYHLRA